MTTITIHLHNGEQLLLVGVPMDANQSFIPENILYYVSKSDRGSDELRNIILPDGNYEIIGTWIPRTDVIDFEVQEEWVYRLAMFGKNGFYQNYKYGIPQFVDATFTDYKQAFLSLLKSHTKDSEAEKFCVLKIEKK